MTTVKIFNEDKRKKSVIKIRKAIWFGYYMHFNFCFCNNKFTLA